MTANKIAATEIKYQPAHKNVFMDLRAPGLLAKWPIIGLIMFIFGSLVFAGLTYNLLAQGPLLAWDRVIANTLPAIALKGPGYLKGLMDAGYIIGDQAIMVLGGLIALYLLFKRYWKALAMLAFGQIGSSSLFLLLSGYFARPRPPTQIWIVLNIPGFPSGHAIAVVVFYGLLAYLLVPLIPSVFWKWVVIAMALLIIGFVGFSRVFTGGHYLTDVLSGYAVGIAWSGLVYTLIELISQKRRIHNVKKI